MDRQTAPLPGTRIRNRRVQLGLKQSELARRVNLSASYLNLIEHNRRKIAGKILAEIAEALETTADVLSDGAEAGVISALAVAAKGQTLDEPPYALAEQYPGWAELIINQARRIEELENTVASLGDRLSYNPHLSESLHEVISNVTAIQSSAAILSDTPDIEPQWQARFQRNILEDADRLVDGSKRLISLLTSETETDLAERTPREEFGAFLNASNHFFEDLEHAVVSIDDVISASKDLSSSSSRELARGHLERYVRDAKNLPLETLGRLRSQFGIDPLQIANRSGADIPATLRRMAIAPLDKGAAPLGLALCDGSGALRYAKAAEGFDMPRLGNACPLWPLFGALSQTGVPLINYVVTGTTNPKTFLTISICETRFPDGLSGPLVREATMLVIPSASHRSDSISVGPACAICPRSNCAARNEPSILSSGL